jgi:hypothetical protein
LLQTVFDVRQATLISMVLLDGSPLPFVMAVLGSGCAFCLAMQPDSNPLIISKMMIGLTSFNLTLVMFTPNPILQQLDVKIL